MTPAARRSRHPVVLLAATSLVLAGCGGSSSGTAPGNPRPASYDQYVSLGDSYTAAPGLLPVVDVPCYRAGTNYPAQVADRLEIADHIDASCGGANTTDLVVAQKKQGKPANDPQLEALDGDTDLVTIGIGLNNEGLSARVLYSCLPQFGQGGCEAYLGRPRANVTRALERITEKLVKALGEIHEKAPKARVVLVGYPRVLPDSGGCADLLPLPAEAADRVRLMFTAADAAYREAARKGGADYIDMFAPSEGHDVCSADPWVNGVADGGEDGAALHPTRAEQQAVADRIVALLEKD